MRTTKERGKMVLWSKVTIIGRLIADLRNKAKATATYIEKSWGHAQAMGMGLSSNAYMKPSTIMQP